jgi:3',5'-cyclic AMP phosphodiesterase CpdA
MPPENNDPSRRDVGIAVAATLGAAALGGVARAAEPPAVVPEVLAPTPFGPANPNLDSFATGKWSAKTPKAANAPPPMDVPRNEVVAFALYTCDRGVLKVTAQLYPLKPGEEMVARLEFQRDGQWVEAARSAVEYPGWDAHFRVEKWDQSRDVAYRVRHGAEAEFVGKVRRDPPAGGTVVVANMSCNSSRTTGARPEILDALKELNPDLLFFAGDQTYRHTEHTAGWIEFGLQFRDVFRDRPTVTIPDDHDVGHPNLWGENGKRALLRDGADGGYYYPAAYVNMVQRQQTWHLPDPVDPAPVEQNITVYFTRLRLGGVDFAILEDRKFKSGPAGKIPKMGPRPDHITDPNYDRKAIDLPGLVLLGDRQLKWLAAWSKDWEGANLKVVLSQTAFCGAAHMHGGPKARLLVDLDCNGWPQTGRNAAVEAIRRVRALHLCGDQHISVVVKHGVTEFGDGPYAFTSPALVNTIYGRWWHPEDEQAGPNPVPGSPLPWTGDYLDGLGNKLSMLAYANPKDIQNERERADGFGVVRIDTKAGTATIECHPRFPKKKGEQFPGWPVTVKLADNDGRKPVAWLPELTVTGCDRPVIEVTEEATGAVVSCVRADGPRVQLPVFAAGRYTVAVGRDRPDGATLTGVAAGPKAGAKPLAVTLKPAGEKS